jgi:hypothetical protein
MKSVLYSVILIKVVCGFIYSRLEKVTTGIEKIQAKSHPLLCFFCSVSTLIQSGSIQSCLSAEKLFFII